jgi:hypothetical protein
MRGSNKVLEYKNQCSDRTKTDSETIARNYKKDVLVKAPLSKTRKWRRCIIG